MAVQKAIADATGSKWRRWDPHIHAPGTLLNDQFNGNWEAFLTRLESASPEIRVLGVTDYFSIGGYQKTIAHKKTGRLAGVDLIFPNVEMRLDIKTEKAKGINIHLLFSPHDVDHEAHILRLLSKLTYNTDDRDYSCSPAELVQLGKAHHGKPIDDEAALRIGANQFKLKLSELKHLMKDGWAQQNCLVAISGSSVDGTAGLQGDDSFASTRQDIERLAHIIFSSNAKTRDFWLGKGVLGAYQIEKAFRFLKPCLHGCDAHSEEKVGEPDGNRYCWIKGDPTFDTLRQVVIEPEERAWIGPDCPSVGMAAYSVRALIPKGAAWVKHNRIEFNSGLVAIVGARGSGKTALAEMLAVGTRSRGDQPATSSFLTRASDPTNYLEDASVQVEWRDGEVTAERLDPEQWGFDDEFPQARYLSQQFVDQLCSGPGLATGLRKEIERVVFDAIAPIDRLDADSFIDLAATILQPVQARQSALRDRIDQLSKDIANEEICKRSLPGLKSRQKLISEEISKIVKEATALVPKGKAERAARLTAVETAQRTVQGRIQRLNLQLQKIGDLFTAAGDVLAQGEPSRFSAMRQTFSGAGLSDAEWVAFKMVFVGDWKVTLEAKRQTVSFLVKQTMEGTGQQLDLKTLPLDQWPLNTLGVELASVTKEVGIDADNQKKYDGLQAKLKIEESKLKKLVEQIEYADGAEARRNQLISERKTSYLSIFACLAEEEAELAKLYAPLAATLKGASGALSKLKVVVRRRVAVADWAVKGEQFIDLRVAEKLRGKGTLAKEADKLLLKAWTRGLPSAVADAMEAFREAFSNDLMDSARKTVDEAERIRRVQEIAAWLYDTSHIRVEYGIEFDGVEIELLSPGTRGIVLLLLYLAIDQTDRRPLIVDQPEENLDPQSVYDELVPHFRAARRRRQVFVVTHNANLVVNVDADQVIVATATREGEGLPAIRYNSGSLENPEIRQAVCNILEGGNRAFMERERRYRIRWEEVVLENSVP